MIHFKSTFSHIPNFPKRIKFKFSSSAVCLCRPENIDNDEDEDANSQLYLKIFQSKRKEISADIHNLLSSFPKKFQLDTKYFKELYSVMKKRSLFHDQRYIDQRVDILGYDLAAAHFIVHRGGKVRFKGCEEWFKLGDDDIEVQLPDKYTPEFVVEAIDASGLKIIYDGLQNIEHLSSLKWLSFSRCPYINDWCMDRLCDQNYPNLSYLDISYCPNVTTNGMTTLSKMKTLKTMNVAGLDHISHLNLLCLLLQDAIPALKLEGISLGESVVDRAEDNDVIGSALGP